MKVIQLKAENLKINYDRQVALNIEQLDLKGNVIAILGHNGAGKSTLLKTLLELLQPQSGYLRACSQSGQIYKASKHMAFCPENGAVFEDIPVKDYIRVWLRLRAKKDDLKQPVVQELLDLFELQPLLKKLGRELSKGQRRRVQSVVGFLIEPEVFLFDEPFDGLDIQKTAELTSIMENWKSKTSFIISSHRMDVIERVCDSGLVLAHGKVIASGNIQDLPSTLAGQCFSVSLPDSYEIKTLSNISDKSGCYVSHIGQTLIFTGSGCNQQEIMQKLNLPASAIKVTAPTLTDAMGYHLKSL